MNHIYRVVFNRSLGVYQCVSELAKSSGKSSGKSQVATKFIVAPLAVAMIGLSGTAMAVTYDNGQTTTINDEIYSVVNDVVKNSGTVLSVNNLVMNSNSPASSLVITERGKVTASGVTLITNDAKATITQSGQLNTNELAIGFEGNGILSVTSGGRVIANDIELGLETASSQGTLNIIGQNTSVTTDEIEVGKDSSGILRLSGGGSLTASSGVFAGFGANSQGIIDINNGSLTAEDLVIGRSGNGKLTINNGTASIADNVNIAQQSGSKGEIVVDGSNSILSTKTIAVGIEGNGTLTVNNGGTVNATSNDANDVGAVIVSSSSSSKGIVNVIDAGSKLLTDEMSIGDTAQGNGDLNIAKGAKVNVAKVMRVANDISTTGAVNIDEGTLSTPDLTVGYAGNGKLNAKKATINVDQLIVGHQISGTGNVTLDEGSDLQNTNGLAIGRQGKGTLTLKDKSNLTSKAVIVVGSEFGSVGNLIAQGQSNVKSDEIIIGDNSTGNVNIESGSSVTVAKNTILGRNNLGRAEVIIDGAGSVLNSNGEFLGIADNGRANVTVKNKGKIKANTTILGNNLGSIGSLTVTGDVAEIDSDNLVVGGAGRGTLNINDKGLVKVGNIYRTNNLVGSSTISFDGGILQLTKDQNALFNNFGNSNAIELKDNGGIFDTQANNVSVFQNAVISGTGNFTKKGTGLLGMNTSSKQWTGATSINQGTLRLDGNYVMRDGEILGIGLNSLDDYGKLTVKGNADISKGELQVNASEAVQKLTGSNEWKNVVTATKRQGEFKSVTDNSPLVSFYADYSDANAVHLKMGTAPVVEPPVKPEPPVVVPPVKPEPPIVVPPVKPEPPVVVPPVKPEPPIVVPPVKPEPPVVVPPVKPEPPIVVPPVKPEPPVVVPPVKPEPPVVVPPVKPEPPVVVPPVKPEPPVVVPPVKPEPPVVVPPVKPEPPVVVPPVKPEPPVVVPPVKPEPPVVDPTDTDSTFVAAANSQSDKQALSLATVLDKAMMNKKSPLAIQLIADTEDLVDNPTLEQRQIRMNKTVYQLQPLFMGATNRIITDANYAVSDAITEHRPTTAQSSIWAKIIGNDSSHDAENGVTGYNSDGYGAIVGLDMPVNNNLNLGLAVSYIQSDADTAESRLDHELKAKSLQVLGYGNYAVNDATAVNFHAGAGSSDVDGERHLSILSNATANSDYSVDTLQAGLGISHRIGSEQSHVSPFTKVNYAHAKSDAYRETGAGVYNLNVDENKYESMRWTAGLNMSQLLTPRLAITGQLAAAIENGDKYSDVTASFVDMPNDKFTTVGQEVGREIGIAGIGLSYTPTLNTKLSVGYRGEWRDNYDDQGASIALQTTF